MWQCGDPSKNVPPYMLFCHHDVAHIKGERLVLNQMRYLMRYLIKPVYRAAEYVNLPHLIVFDWAPSDALDVYNSTKTRSTQTCRDT
eukprot:929737-Ditylum_brightwellii.AAC.1